MSLDFLTIGHVSRDIGPDTPEGWRLGGTVAFAAVLAQRLGLQAAILTSAGPDLPLSALLPGIDITCIPSDRSTQFENRYDAGHRTQWVQHRACPIAPCDIPAGWTQPRLALIGPIIGEVDRAIPQQFPASVVGICLQGWLRRIDDESRVRPISPVDFSPVAEYPNAAALFLTDEDLDPTVDHEATLAAWTSAIARGPLVVYTKGRDGADIWSNGTVRHIAAFPVTEVDATGAGDIFAAAFLIHLSETGDSAAAARYATAATAVSIGARGLDSVPDSSAIQQMLNDHPEVRLQ
jgi:hypothetical protein